MACAQAAVYRSTLSGLLCCSSIFVMNVPLLPCRGQVHSVRANAVLLTSQHGCHTSPDCLVANEALPHEIAANPHGYNIMS